MTDALIIGLISTIPSTLVGTAVLITSLRTAKKTEQVHVLVNSKFTTVVKELAVAKQLIDDLYAELQALRT